MKGLLYNYTLSEWKRKLDLACSYVVRKIFDLPGVMIVGCGRSGTTFTAKLFQSYGYSIGHERMLKNGISSWYLVGAQSDPPFGPSYSQVECFELPIIHQVRYPLKTIASVSTFNEKSWEYVSTCLNDDLSQDSVLLKGMKYWYYWNKMAQHMTEMTYRVEDIDEVIEDIFNIAGFEMVENRTSLPSKRTNTRKHSSLSWDMLTECDADLTNKIQGLAESYGYTV